MFAWHKSFSSGREYVQNTPHPLRPKTSVTLANIEAARQLIEHVRRIAIDEICSEVNISRGRVVSIVRNEFKFRKITTT